MNYEESIFTLDFKSLYHTATAPMDSIHPKLQQGLFSLMLWMMNMLPELVEQYSVFKRKQDSTANPELLNTKSHYLENIIVRYVPVKEKVGRPEVNRLTNGSITNTLTAIDIQELVNLVVK